MAKVEFVTTDFEFTYGKRPSGYGNWAFSWKRHPDVLSHDIMWCHGLYSQAKKDALELLAWKQEHDGWPKSVCALWVLS